MLDSELEPIPIEREMLQIVDLGEQQKANEERQPQDPNSDLLKEVEMLRRENKWLREQNHRKNETIEFYQQKLGDYGFVCEAEQLEKHIMMKRNISLEMDVAKMVLQNDIESEEKERLRKQNINLEVEVGSIMVENDIVKEKLDDALDTIDDIEAHKLSQELEVL